MDSNGDGTISAEDLKTLMERIGMRMDHETLIKMIDEIDLNKNGLIELKEFLEIMSNVQDLKNKKKFSKFMEEFEHYLANLPAERSGGGI